MPAVKVLPDGAVIGGGMDIVGSPIFAKPGTARLAYNYEYTTKGGVQRLGGIEPVDGRPSPSDAEYDYIQCDAAITGAVVGDTVEGVTSGATAVVIYVSGAYMAYTKKVGDFEEGEDLEVSSTVVGTILSLSPALDGFLDNTLAKAAADVYQADIGKVPGAGPVRGIAALNDVGYAWRNNSSNTAMVIYKTSASGWVPVTMYHQISFTAGSSEYTDGETLTQGSASATIKRVVLESGTWGAGTAAGRFIITAPSGGTFSAGAAAGGGSCTLSGASALITLAINGRVRTDTYNFTASLTTKRLYGCDGVNPEFEFDGDVYVPLSTGMGTIRATAVRCHKQHVFFGYRGSLQHAAIGNPYVWSAVFGAAELGTGDTITNMISVGGATDAAALMVTCENSLFVLYGNSSADWNLQPLSRVSGARAYSAQDIGGVVALDAPGVMRYPTTRNFGNFAWDIVSQEIQPLVRDKECVCSVYVPGLFKYRLFFSDGTVISGLPVGNKEFHWSVLDYGRNIVLAEYFEINGVPRTFYADDQGWVYEADKGRSMAGESFQWALRLHPMTARSPMVLKTYRQMRVELETASACTLKSSVEFDNGDDGPTQEVSTPQYGVGLVWGLSNWAEAYWGTPMVATKDMPCEGEGVRVSVTFAGESDKELPHSLYSLTLLYTPRRMTR